MTSKFLLLSCTILLLWSCGSEAQTEPSAIQRDTPISSTTVIQTNLQGDTVDFEWPLDSVTGAWPQNLKLWSDAPLDRVYADGTRLRKRMYYYGYINEDTQLKIQEHFPGILYYDPSMTFTPDAHHLIKFYDEEGKVKRVVDLDDMNPYNAEAYPSLVKGGFPAGTFGDDEFDNAVELVEDFKSKAASLVNNIHVTGQNNGYTIVHYGLKGASKSALIGYERTVMILNPRGDTLGAFTFDGKIQGLVSDNGQYLTLVMYPWRLLKGHGSIQIIDIPKGELIYVEELESDISLTNPIRAERGIVCFRGRYTSEDTPPAQLCRHYCFDLNNRMRYSKRMSPSESASATGRHPSYIALFKEMGFEESSF